MEEWRTIDRSNVMLCFVLEKKEELTEEREAEFRQAFEDKFGFKPDKVKLGPPKRHVWVGNWKETEVTPTNESRTISD